MITVTTISFEELAQKKARARLLDQQLVNQGHAQAVQKNRVVASKKFKMIDENQKHLYENKTNDRQSPGFPRPRE